MAYGSSFVFTLIERSSVTVLTRCVVGTPYLLSLGLSKSMMSLVWIAGPLSGSFLD